MPAPQLTHPETLFLLERAWSLWHAAAKARAEGEEFHSARAYSPLECGMEASSEIVDGRLCLYLRHRPNDAKLAEAAPGICAAFLGPEMGDVEVTPRPGYIHYKASSPTVPPSILGKNAGVRPDPPGDAPAPYCTRGAPRDRRADRGVRGGV